MSQNISFLTDGFVFDNAHIVEQLRQLMIQDDLHLWLMALINFGNQFNTQKIEFVLWFHQWDLEQKQNALDLFTDIKLINLINAVFFYKLYPEQLFNEAIHPEKLISVRVRLELLHHYIEKIQQQLYCTAIQYGLKPKTDYLLHGTELPQGITIEVSDQFRALIQSSIKHVIIQPHAKNEEQIMIERVHDLFRAYKFGFNPDRLVDALIFLQQHLVKEELEYDSDTALFHFKMITLYQELSSTECLELYNYFGNNDTRCWLNILLATIHETSLDWLPVLGNQKKKIIKNVFYTLKTAMEAVRSELNNRGIRTRSYVYEFIAFHQQVNRCNKEAVLRLLAIYGSEPLTDNDALEQLFTELEQS